MEQAYEQDNYEEESTRRRNQMIVDRVLSGEPQTQVGRSFGISRQRVHQIVKEAEPSFNAYELTAQSLDHLKLPRPPRGCCLVCHEALAPNDRRVHQGDCTTALRALRDRTIYNDTHRRSVARWYLRNPEHPDVNEPKIRWAKRVLAGMPRRRTWLRRDSKTYKLLAKYDLLRYLPEETVYV